MNLVLLVESDPRDRERLGAWLEHAGYSLMDCPGPRREDFSCLGIRGQRCALVEIADMAILDGRVLHDVGGNEKRAARLLHYYLQSGKPVLVLLDAAGQPVHFEGERVASADRLNREAILTAARELLDVGCVAS